MAGAGGGSRALSGQTVRCFSPNVPECRAGFAGRDTPVTRPRNVSHSASDPRRSLGSALKPCRADADDPEQDEHAGAEHDGQDGAGRVETLDAFEAADQKVERIDERELADDGRPRD